MKRHIKVIAWNIHKAASSIASEPFVAEHIAKQNADIICLLEYNDDNKITGMLEKDYYHTVSDTVSGNRVLLAVKKELLSESPAVINSIGVQQCYDMLHIYVPIGKGVNILGVRFLSPTKAKAAIKGKEKAAALIELLDSLEGQYICVGDFNLTTNTIKRWFSGSIIAEAEIDSYSYVFTNGNKITGFAALDHLIHSEGVTINNAIYDWSFTKKAYAYPDKPWDIGTPWRVRKGYPDHAMLVCELTIS